MGLPLQARWIFNCWYLRIATSIHFYIWLKLSWLREAPLLRNGWMTSAAEKSVQYNEILTDTITDIKIRGWYCYSGQEQMELCLVTGVEDHSPGKWSDHSMHTALHGAVCSVRCTLDTMHCSSVQWMYCTVHSARCTLHIALITTHCTLCYTVCAVCTVYCTALCTVHWSLPAAHCIAYWCPLTVHCLVFSFALCIVQCALIICPLHTALPTGYHSLHCALHAVEHCALYTVLTAACTLP